VGSNVRERPTGRFGMGYTVSVNNGDRRKAVALHLHMFLYKLSV
jgi:hypothetical protein